MPLYEYECEACGQRFEMIQKFSDEPPTECRLCSKGPVRRLMSSPAIQFKGSGWYITDYAKKSGSDGSASGAKSESKSDAPAKTEGTTTPSKSEATTTTPKE